MASGAGAQTAWHVDVENTLLSQRKQGLQAGLRCLPCSRSAIPGPAPVVCREGWDFVHQSKF